MEWSFECNILLTTRSWRRDLGLKSHPKDWRRGGSNEGSPDCRTSTLTTAPLSFQLIGMDKSIWQIRVKLNNRLHLLVLRYLSVEDFTKFS